MTGGAGPAPPAPRRSARLRLRALRQRLRGEARARTADALADLAEAALGPIVGWPLPPARLRRGVARSSSREEYLKAGALAVAELLAFLARAGRPLARATRLLDFGCGAGRLAGLLLASRAVDTLTGVDVDAAAIRWCQRRLPAGRFLAIAPAPPLPFPPAAFDLVLAASVFTHFDEPAQLAWLDELARVLAPGGLLVASTHAPALLALRPEVDAAGRAELEGRGFLFVPGDDFNDGAAFHAPDYLAREWSRRLRPVYAEPAALFALQDLAAWEKPA